MRSIRAALLVLLVPASLVAQRPVPTTTSAPANARGSVPPRGMREIREADLRRDLFAMASPAMRGREGGSLDEMKASIWVAEQYARLGLEPAGEDGTWFQWFSIVRTRVSRTASQATIAGREMALFSDLIPLGAVPVEATGAVLWLADAADTTVDLRGRVVATMLRSPAAGSIRQTSYPLSARYADAAIATTLARLTRRGASAILLVASPEVDTLLAVVAVQRERGAYDVDHAVPRAAGGSDRVAPPPELGAGASPALLVPGSYANVLQLGAPVTISVRLERFEVPSVNVMGC